MSCIKWPSITGGGGGGSGSGSSTSDGSCGGGRGGGGDSVTAAVRNTYNAALKAITDAGEAAGLFHDLALAEALEANSVPLDDDCTFAADGLSFFERRRKKHSPHPIPIPCRAPSR